nr:hypothetical protein [Tanacetum cinerariifolium]
MKFNNTGKGNHSDDLGGHRCLPPWTGPSPAHLLFGHAPIHEQQSNLSTTITEDGEMEKTSIAYRVREHVKMGSKLSETFKGKVRLGARIIQKGGRENIFKEVFGESEGEKLLKASQCYLSMTAGPIAGTLFISTKKVAFYSDRSITLSSHNGDLIREPYKVVIPTNKITMYGREDAQNPSQKYIQIVRDDSTELKFMGFIRYEKAFHNLRKAISFVPNQGNPPR